MEIIDTIEEYNKLSKNITYLTFGHCFNQKIKLSKNITHLIFGFHFSQKINLSNSITHLTLGYIFNQKINLYGIKYLIFGTQLYWIGIKQNLPNAILIIHEKFTYDNIIPNHIKIIYH